MIATSLIDQSGSKFLIPFKLTAPRQGQYGIRTHILNHCGATGTRTRNNRMQIYRDSQFHHSPKLICWIAGTRTLCLCLHDFRQSYPKELQLCYNCCINLICYFHRLGNVSLKPTFYSYLNKLLRTLFEL